MAIDEPAGAGTDDPTLPEVKAVVIGTDGSPDRHEADFGFAAAVTDRGLRHHRNEDAFGLVAGSPGRAVAAVCDGVSSSANPHRASSAAAAAAVTALEPLLERDPASDSFVGEALRAAVAAASQAVGAVDPNEPGGYMAAPSTTIVTVVADPGRLAIGSIGDSRAYLITTADDAERTTVGVRLTTDDSLAEMAIAQGVPAETAYNSPQAHVITRWLGANEGGGGEPSVSIYEIDRAALLLVCTDGLWNYFEAPGQLAELATEAPGDGTPLDVARALVQAAIDAGGGDNITVAVMAVGPEQPEP